MAAAREVDFVDEALVVNIDEINVTEISVRQFGTAAERR